MHAVSVDADNRLGEEACGQPHLSGDLTADQFVKLDLVGSGDHFTVAVIDFKLRRRNFRVVFFVLETHGALHFGGRVDEGAERVAGQGVIVATGIYVFELAGFV